MGQIMADEKNKKIPPSDAKWEYPWNQVTTTLGGHEIFHNSTPGEECTRIQHPSGTYEENTKDGHQVKLVVNQKNDLVSNGFSHTVEGTTDALHVGGIRKSIPKSGKHEENAANESRAVKGNIVKSSKLQVNHTGNPGNPGLDYHVSHNTISEHRNDGAGYHYVLQADKQVTSNTKIFGAQNQMMMFAGSNMDIYSDAKSRFYSTSNMIVQTNATMNTISQSDMLIQSDSQITIKVGSSSITLTPNDITIKSPLIKFEQG